MEMNGIRNLSHPSIRRNDMFECPTSNGCVYELHIDVILQESLILLRHIHHSVSTQNDHVQVCLTICEIQYCLQIPVYVVCFFSRINSYHCGNGSRSDFGNVKSNGISYCTYLTNGLNNFSQSFIKIHTHESV